MGCKACGAPVEDKPIKLFDNEWFEDNGIVVDEKEDLCNDCIQAAKECYIYAKNNTPEETEASLRNYFYDPQSRYTCELATIHTEGHIKTEEVG